MPLVLGRLYPLLQSVVSTSAKVVLMKCLHVLSSMCLECDISFVKYVDSVECSLEVSVALKPPK